MIYFIIYKVYNHFIRARKFQDICIPYLFQKYCKEINIQSLKIWKKKIFFQIHFEKANSWRHKILPKLFNVIEGRFSIRDQTNFERIRLNNFYHVIHLPVQLVNDLEMSEKRKFNLTKWNKLNSFKIFEVTIFMISTK